MGYSIQVAPSYEEFQKTLEQRLEEMSLSFEKENQEDNAKKNNNFVQFSRSNMGAVRNMAIENPVATSIFIFLSEYMNRRNAVVCPSKVLQEITGKSRPTVARAISYLKEKGYLSILKSGSTNVYVLNPHVVWASSRTDKSFCEFQGTILISKSENEKLIDEIVKRHNVQLDIKP